MKEVVHVHAGKWMLCQVSPGTLTDIIASGIDARSHIRADRFGDTGVEEMVMNLEKGKTLPSCHVEGNSWQISTLFTG
jgi:hypothetical protein